MLESLYWIVLHILQLTNTRRIIFFFVQAHQAEEENLGDTVVLLQIYLGLAWTLGCVIFGLLVVHRSVECRIARQYLMQAAIFICGLCILALTAVQGNYHGYVMFVWIYGNKKINLYSCMYLRSSYNKEYIVVMLFDNIMFSVNYCWDKY